MSQPKFPPVDRQRFVWHQDPADASHHTRETVGGETADDLFNRFVHGEQNLFLGVDLTLHAPVPADAFLANTRDAWRALRFDIPTIASQMEYTAEGRPLLAYRAPASDADARAWAERTVIPDGRNMSLDDLRFEIGQKPLPDANKDQTFVYVVPRSDTAYGLLMYTHHTPFDGVGTKVVFTLFLRKLAHFIAGDPSEVPTAWGAEVERLLPSINEALGPDEEREGPRFEQTTASVTGDMARCPPLVHGFRKRNVGPGPTRRLGFKYSEEESAKLIAKAKELQLTINQVAHAAVFMVCVKDNPPTAETRSDALLMHFGLVNSRAQLAAPYNERLAYPGYCLGMSPIKVPVSLISGNAGKSDKELMLLVAHALKEEYATQKALPSLLAISPHQGDLMIKVMTSGHHPPPWMGPWYSGDGIGETYLDAEYADDSGKPVIKVDDFMQSLNKTAPGPFFRSWSWAKRLSLSVDYNETAMPRDDVQGFLDQWVELVRLIL